MKSAPAKIASIGTEPAESCITLFLQFKTSLRSSHLTLRAYGFTLRQFFRLHPTAWDSPTSMRTDFLSWISEDIAPATYNHRLIYTRAFWRWAIEEGLQPELPDPFRNVKRQNDPGRFLDIDADKIALLMTKPDRTRWTGLRDYALIIFTLDTATRPGEALQLVPSDFNFKDNTVTIPAAVAKTREVRVIPFSATTAVQIAAFPGHRPPSWSNSVPVFSTITGTRMTETSWRTRLQEYPLFDGTVFKPYDLRHAACTLHLRAGMTGEALQRLMGHHGPQMTQRYIHLTVDDLRQQQAISSPIEKLVSRRERACRKLLS